MSPSKAKAHKKRTTQRGRPWTRKQLRGFVAVPAEYWDRVMWKLSDARKLVDGAMGDGKEQHWLIVDQAQLYSDLVAMHVGEVRL